MVSVRQSRPEALEAGLHVMSETSACSSLAQGVARASYQVQTTTSAGGGYFEYFMGDEGSLKMSENPGTTAIYREERAPDRG